VASTLPALSFFPNNTELLFFEGPPATFLVTRKCRLNPPTPSCDVRKIFPLPLSYSVPWFIYLLTSPLCFFVFFFCPHLFPPHLWLVYLEIPDALLNNHVTTFFLQFNPCPQPPIPLVPSFPLIFSSGFSTTSPMILPNPPCRPLDIRGDFATLSRFPFFPLTQAACAGFGSFFLLELAITTSLPTLL